MEASDKKITAEYVRDNFPACVEFADECRSVFGDGVRMVYAKEGDKVIGKQSVGDAEVCLADVDLSPLLTKEQIKRGGRGGR